MKYLIILADGAADAPIVGFGDRTPLQAARTPHIDRLAREGVNGRFKTVPDGFHPGSEIANLGVLGYDVREVFEGRGSLEAASMGVDIAEGEVAMRCNLICIENGTIKNHSAGNITTEEADELIAFLNKELFGGASPKTGGIPEIRKGAFYTGVSYRHLLKLRRGSKYVHCTPPHDEIGKPFAPFMPYPERTEAMATSQLLCDLIRRSMEILPKHPINQRRAAEGKDMANAIWPWSLGYHPTMETMMEHFPIRSGSVISAVDLIFGIGVYAGLEKIEVPGATGLYTTNYEGKAEAALRELREKDFVFLHIEASDEAGHDGDAELKRTTIESLDQRCLRIILEEIETWEEPVRIALLPDHPTPIYLRTHTNEPIPFVIWQSHQTEDMATLSVNREYATGGAFVVPDDVQTFDEEACYQGRLGLIEGDTFIRAFFSERP